MNLNVTPVYEIYNMTGRNVSIAVVDDGIEYDHPDLKKNYVSFIIFWSYDICYTSASQTADLEAHRVVHGSNRPTGRVGSGHDFAGIWWVGSGQHFRFF